MAKKKKESKEEVIFEPYLVFGDELVRLAFTLERREESEKVKKRSAKLLDKSARLREKIGSLVEKIRLRKKEELLRIIKERLKSDRLINERIRELIGNICVVCAYNDEILRKYAEKDFDILRKFFKEFLGGYKEKPSKILEISIKKVNTFGDYEDFLEFLRGLNCYCKYLGNIFSIVRYFLENIVEVCIRDIARTRGKEISEKEIKSVLKIYGYDIFKIFFDFIKDKCQNKNEKYCVKIFHYNVFHSPLVSDRKTILKYLVYFEKILEAIPSKEIRGNMRDIVRASNEFYNIFRKFKLIERKEELLGKEYEKILRNLVKLRVVRRSAELIEKEANRATKKYRNYVEKIVNTLSSPLIRNKAKQYCNFLINLYRVRNLVEEEQLRSFNEKVTINISEIENLSKSENPYLKTIAILNKFLKEIKEKKISKEGAIGIDTNVLEKIKILLILYDKILSDLKDLLDTFIGSRNKNIKNILIEVWDRLYLLNERRFRKLLESGIVRDEKQLERLLTEFFDEFLLNRRNVSLFYSVLDEIQEYIKNNENAIKKLKRNVRKTLLEVEKLSYRIILKLKIIVERKLGIEGIEKIEYLEKLEESAGKGAQQIEEKREKVGKQVRQVRTAFSKEQIRRAIESKRELTNAVGTIGKIISYSDILDIKSDEIEKVFEIIMNLILESN